MPFIFWQQLTWAGASGVVSSSVFLDELSSVIEERDLDDRRVRFFGNSTSSGATSCTRSFFVYNLAPRVGFSGAGELDCLAVAFLARDGDLALAGLFDLDRDFLTGDFLAALEAALTASLDLDRGFLVSTTGSEAASVTLELNSSLDANLDDLTDIFEYSF